MPDNKNQHYVPRCHFKPFSLDRAGLAINLYNHVRDKVVGNVPIAGQCAKSYFYGEDLVLERHLQRLEGRYASTVRRAETDEPLTDPELSFLRDFVLLQWCRTDGALRRRREVMQAMDEMTRRGLEHLRHDQPDMSQRALVTGSLKVWASAGEDARDLRVLILRNRSRIDFVTSDDPAILTNRVFLQRMRDTNFGVINVGTMFTMPLGPRHAVVRYDHGSYAPIGRAGCYLDVTRDRDASALNELQYINTLSNIYFAGPVEQSDRIREGFAAVADCRPTERFRMWQGISEGIVDGFECFRRVADGETLDAETPRIQSFSPIYSSPRHWMSVLPMRDRLTGWIAPGTIIGPIRASSARLRRGMRQIAIGHRPMPHRGGELPERMYHRLSAAELRETVARREQQAERRAAAQRARNNILRQLD